MAVQKTKASKKHKRSRAYFKHYYALPKKFFSILPLRYNTNFSFNFFFRSVKLRSLYINSYEESKKRPFFNIQYCNSEARRFQKNLARDELLFKKWVNGYKKEDL